MTTMTTLRQQLLHEAGQSLILVALALAVLLGLLGLVLDGGNLYLARRDSQNASDAAAFAGVRQLVMDAPRSDPAILGQVNQFAQDNHVDTAGANVTAWYVNAQATPLAQVGGGSVPGSATGVRVVTTITVPSFFINLLSGIDEYPASTVATVQGGQLTGGQVMPMAVVTTSIRYTGTTSLSLGEILSTGGFQWVDLTPGATPTSCPSGSGNKLEQQLTKGAVNPPVTIGEYLCAQPGVTIGNAKRALDSWFPLPVNWFIPIVNPCTICHGGNAEYQVVAIALFQFTSYQYTGSNKILRGQFLRWAVADDFNGAGQCNVRESGICTLGLTQ